MNCSVDIDTETYISLITDFIGKGFNIYRFEHTFHVDSCQIYNLKRFVDIMFNDVNRIYKAYNLKQIASKEVLKNFVEKWNVKNKILIYDVSDVIENDEEILF